MRDVVGPRHPSGVAVWLVLVNVPLIACDGGDTTDAIAEALGAILATSAESGGEVQVKRAREAYWEPAPIATVFKAGDWVRTGRHGYARLEFAGGGRLELGTDALLVIDTFDLEPDPATAGAERAPLIAVESGSVRGTLRREGGRARSLLIRAADGSHARLEAGPDGTEFRVSENESGTRIVIRRGDATLEAAGGKRVIAAGGAAELARGRLTEIDLPDFPRSLAPAPDARLRWRNDAPVELRWAAVPEGGGYRVQIAADIGFRQIQSILDVTTTRLGWQPPAAQVYAWRVATRAHDGKLGEFGFARRVFFERDQPRDLLQSPADGAAFGLTGKRVSIGFSWKPARPGAVYRLVVARNADLLSKPVVDRISVGTEVATDRLGPGRYLWGVYLAGDIAEDEPIFLKPRRLTIKKVGQQRLRAPRTIRRWGE